MTIINQGVFALFIALAFLILLNTVLGVSLALKAGTFDIRELPRFLKTEVLPFYLSLLASTIPVAFIDFGKYEDPFMGIIGTIELMYLSRLLALIKDQIAQLTGSTNTVN